jgi:hypothetical protein
MTVLAASLFVFAATLALSVLTITLRGYGQKVLAVRTSLRDDTVPSRKRGRSMDASPEWAMPARCDLRPVRPLPPRPLLRPVPAYGA